MVMISRTQPVKLWIKSGVLVCRPPVRFRQPARSDQHPVMGCVTKVSETRRAVPKMGAGLRESPFQELAANHPELLPSKGVVVNIRGKGVRKGRQVSIEKMSESCCGALPWRVTTGSPSGATRAAGQRLFFAASAPRVNLPGSTRLPSSAMCSAASLGAGHAESRFPSIWLSDR
jgi:hypothetical protein